ncbi:MAG: hypothetical protein HZB38_05295 [Planctomycetes bacterium]|nr:hypothetical protein [Planctomycetota bacterium]
MSPTRAMSSTALNSPSPPEIPRRPPIRLWQALLIVLIVGGVVRVLATASLSLIIQNDSVEYLKYTRAILAGDFAPPRPDRTPGYPALLALVFATFGPSPTALLAIQHALGLCGCLLLAWATAVRSGPLAGAFAGTLAATDPWLLCFESYAMTEAPSTVFVLAATAVVLIPTRRRLIWGGVLGLLLAALCLIRPTFQVIVPFFALAFALDGGGGWRDRTVRLSAVLAALAIGLAPWLLFQRATQGEARLSFGNGAHLFSGVARVGLVKEDYPLPPDVQAAYAPYAGKPMGDVAFWNFCWRIEGHSRNEALLRAWSLASIRVSPAEYARCVLHAAAWQLNFSMDGGPLDWHELHDIVNRVAREGDGVQYDPGAVNPLLDQLNHSTAGGPLRPLLDRIGRKSPRGVPQVPLLACALIVAGICVFRRNSALALILLGSLAFLAAHAAFLFPNGRYQLPTWILWYMTPALLIQWSFKALLARRVHAAAPSASIRKS